MMKSSTALLAAALVAACGGTTGVPSEIDDFQVPGPAPALQTTADRYVLTPTAVGWEVAIPFTYRNRTSSTAFVVTCAGPTPPMLQKRVGDRWVTAWGAVVPLCLGPPLLVAPDESHSGVLELFAGYPGTNFHPQFVFDDPAGVYRLVWDLQSPYDADRYPAGPLLPEELRISNAFELTEGR